MCDYNCNRTPTVKGIPYVIPIPFPSPPQNTHTHTHTVDTSASGPRGRKACLEVSQGHYERFMAQCERLRLLRGEDLRAWEAEVRGGGGVVWSL